MEDLAEAQANADHSSAAGTSPGVRRRAPTLIATVSLVMAALALYLAASARVAARNEAAASARSKQHVDSEIRNTARAILAYDSVFVPLFVDGRLESWSPQVDLRASQLQNAGGDFEVGDLTVAADPGGARISGLIVNVSAVGHTMASFRFSARGIDRDFTVQHLPSGGSSRFSVDVPGLSADSALYGSIRLVSSTIQYHGP